jgi:hypothetical protein
MVSVLHGHHLTEDDLAFPYFAGKLPGTPFGKLAEQHQEMAAILDGLQAVLEAIERDANIASRLDDLTLLLIRMKEKWHPHIQIEEKHFEVQKVGELLSAEEQLRLIKQYGEFSQQHTGPPYLTVPFILYNLPEEIRGILAKGMPSEIVEHLVPVVWKEKWESMKPFLLA